MNSNYLVIREEGVGKEFDFQHNMLLHNTIIGLLSVKIQILNKETCYYYNITSKQTLHTILETKLLSYQEIKTLVLNIIEIIESSKEYLLDENNFILDTEYIYINYSNHKAYLCYKIGYHKNLKDQMKTFMESLMNKVNYKDDKAVLLIYGLYKISTEESCTFQDMKKAIEESSNMENQRIKELEYNNGEINSENSKNINSNIHLEDISDTNNNKNVLLENDKSNPVKSLNEIKVKATNESDITNKSSSNIFNKTKHLLQKDNKTKQKKPILITNNNKINLDPPLMNERIQSEIEVEYYSIKTKLIAGSSILITISLFFFLIQSKLVLNDIGNKIDSTKLIGVIIILLSIEAYILSKLLNPDKKSTQMKSTIEYIDMNDNAVFGDSREVPVLNFKKPKRVENLEGNNQIEDNEIEEKHIEENQKTECNISDFFEVSNEETILLKDFKQQGYKLIPLHSKEYMDIEIIEFPFFVGKLKVNRGYTIDSSAVSRFHLKIEEDNNKFYITDLNSTNGTLLNNKKLEPNTKYELKVEDQITIAHIVYRFVLI
jgi:hypothetical protein